MALIKTNANDYWIASNALHIDFNANGNPDYIQASCVSGTQILVYVKDIITLDAGHNYRKWPLQAVPTVFNTTTEKYVYVAIPRSETVRNALVVFPSEEIDIYGRNANEEQIGSTDYYYIYLQAIITASVIDGVQHNRGWKDGKKFDTGYLSTPELGPTESAWYQYNTVYQIATFLKDITMAAGHKFLRLFAETINVVTGGKIVFDAGGEVNKVASYGSVADNEDDEIVTPKYIHDRETDIEEKYLRKDMDDATAHKLTIAELEAGTLDVFGNTILQGNLEVDGNAQLNSGATFGEYQPGLTGSGGKIDDEGHGELRSLKLWEWLEVPELRYNRVSIYTGIRWDTFGGGIIESITPNASTGTGSGTLKLDDGEIGAIAVGDLCMGIWHDTSGNATTNSDDNVGNFTFAGFKTVYFLITGVSGANNQNFTYMLRSEAQGGNGFHPFVGMHFAGRGNIEDETRQSFTYTTTEYSLSLRNVSTWVFQPANYYEIHGHIEGFKMPAIDKDGEQYLKEFHGYGQVFGNAYMFGSLDQFERVSYRCIIDQSLGGSLAPSEEEEVSVKVIDGYGIDVTEQFTYISVTRDTGDASSDALWNAQHTSVSNPFTIAFDDLGIDGIRKVMAVFYVEASDASDNTANGEVDYFS